jgi:opacity protein-like surface antigen
MKRLLAVFLLITMVSAGAVAQDSTMPPQVQPPTMAQHRDAPADQPSTTVAGMPDGGSSAPASAHTTYGSEGYGGRAEVFVTGFGLFASHANGNSITEQETSAGGAAVGYRFHLNSSSALEGRYGFSRNSDKYTIGGTASSIPSYFSEISGSYVYTFGKSQRIRPFLEGGGGVALFIPGNYGTPTNLMNGATPTGAPTGIVGGYALPTRHAQAVLGPVYSGSSAGIGTQGRGMFLYGAGADIPAFSHFYFRTEFRGLGYQAPDFKLNALHTNAFSFAYEPSVGLAYRF